MARLQALDSAVRVEKPKRKEPLSLRRSNRKKPKRSHRNSES